MKKVFLLVALMATGLLNAQSGAIDYWTNSFTKVKLPIGSSGKVLTVVGGLPSWQTGSTAPTITLTTTSTGGASTYSVGALNIPVYQSALTNPVTGTAVIGQVAFFTGTSTQTGDAKLFWDNTNKMLGIGNGVPVSVLHVAETSTVTTRGINSDQYSTNTSGARITMRKARGTFVSPTVIVTGDALGSWTADGYDGANFISGAKILVTSAGTIGTNTVPATMALQTATSTGVLTTGLSIDQSQNISITNTVTAGAIVKSGGTSSQFLKADGSVDASTYVSLTNTVTLTNKTITPLSTSTIAITATTTVNGQSNFKTTISANTSTLTAVTVTYTNIPDGGSVSLYYYKITATDAVWTFPSGTVVSNGGDATVTGAGLIATMASTTSGKFRIFIEREVNTYNVFITKSIQ